MGATILALAFLSLSPLQKIHPFPVEMLQEQTAAIDMEMVEVQGTTDQDLIPSLKAEKTWIVAEIWRKKLKVDFLLYVLLIISLGMIVWPVLTQKSSTPMAKALAVQELLPTEEYVDELTFAQRSMSGFPTKDEALAWIRSDPFKACEYCKGKTRPAPGSNPDQIQLKTFYKEVPQGANDLRIVLGSIWLVRPAQEMVCRSCGRETKRV